MRWFDALFEAEQDIANALLVGSRARGTERPDSDTDIVVALTGGAARDVESFGRLAARLKSAVGGPVDLVLLDEAPAPLAYRIFRDCRVLVERDHVALVARKARAIRDYLAFRPVEERRAAAAVVDGALLAATIAAVGDATARVRAVLPASAENFIADRTAREVVTLNLLVAIKDCLDLATHWLADAGWGIPESYADVFVALAQHAVIPRELAARLAAVAAFRNLVAHQYGALDWRRVYALAASDLGDLDAFCATLAGQALS